MWVILLWFTYGRELDKAGRLQHPWKYQAYVLENSPISHSPASGVNPRPNTWWCGDRDARPLTRIRELCDAVVSGADSWVLSIRTLWPPYIRALTEWSACSKPAVSRRNGPDGDAVVGIGVPIADVSICGWKVEAHPARLQQWSCENFWFVIDYYSF